MIMPLAISLVVLLALSAYCSAAEAAWRSIARTPIPPHRGRIRLLAADLDRDPRQMLAAVFWSSTRRTSPRSRSPLSGLGTVAPPRARVQHPRHDGRPAARVGDPAGSAGGAPSAGDGPGDAAAALARTAAAAAERLSAPCRRRASRLPATASPGRSCSRWWQPCTGATSRNAKSS